MEPISATTTPTTPTQASRGFAASPGSDFNTFLRMLTVQMQNQDPLNPLNATDFAVQLATFSGVEQQVQTNQMLSGLAAQFSLMGMAQLSGWVGQEARTKSDVWYDGAPVLLAPDPAPGADNAVLTVTDATGRLVSRETVPLDGRSYAWLGADATGNPLPEGRYQLRLESRLGDEVLRTDPIPAYAVIEEARRDGDQITLLLKGGISVSADDVTALRKP
ncbi:flagellar hook capping FlgD N-terminal domain-containing protein [Paragemmobacter ruber]|uniref:Basal-body rod modification protein FlgD n=1 Tax=Paragemmobacter ruber TaxID=1985673 RepID=A0ABW9Y4C7_9RHOB|nr:flagellar hook capping FlgD N-terminal domain-containing protein [Rhodobacter ruber]NBE07396.1 flagellar basal body rod modification protein [Rhodobacter ruber]